jgi:Predicted membrane protein (DUF2254)
MPRLPMSGSLVLGLVRAGLLIYFLHHLARSIQIDAIMGQVEREARWVIDDLYPNGSGYLEPEQRCPDPPASGALLPAGRSGYLRAVQPEPLIRAAARQDLVVWLARQAGDHVVAGTPLAFARRRDLDQPAADAQALQAALAAAVASGFERTMVQDVPFGFGHGRRIVSDLRRTIPLQLAPDKAHPNDPARTLLYILPLGVPGSLVGGVWLQREEAVHAGGSAPSLRMVTHRRDAAPQDVAMSKPSMVLGRRAWALSVHRLLAAERHRFPAWWQDLHPSSAFPPLIRRQMVWACRPALLAIAGLLVDQRQPNSAVALRQLRRFLTEPIDSPLIRDDPDTARRSAQTLQCSFTGHPEP